MNANPTLRVPSLTLHKRTGQAYVRLNGRCHYLGKFGDPETQQKYHQVIAEWLAGGHRTTASKENHIVYDSFGNVVSMSNPGSGTRSMYTGAPRDAETG